MVSWKGNQDEYNEAYDFEYDHLVHVWLCTSYMWVDVAFYRCVLYTLELPPYRKMQ